MMHEPNPSPPPPSTAFLEPVRRGRRWFWKALLVAVVGFLLLAAGLLVPLYARLSLLKRMTEAVGEGNINFRNDADDLRILAWISGHLSDGIEHAGEFVRTHPFPWQTTPGPLHDLATAGLHSLWTPLQNEHFHAALGGNLAEVTIQNPTEVRWHLLRKTIMEARKLRFLGIWLGKSGYDAPPNFIFELAASHPHLEEFLVELPAPGMTDDQLAALARSKSMVEITLTDCDITEDGLLVLRKCPTLRYLRLLGRTPKLSDVSFTKLRSAAPMIKVIKVREAKRDKPGT